VKLHLVVLFLLLSLASFANTPKKVKVLDENNEPVTGAKIISISQGHPVFTDFDGEGEIVPQEQEITVEYIGYISQQVKLPKSGEEVLVVLQKKVPSSAL